MTTFFLRSVSLFALTYGLKTTLSSIRPHRRWMFNGNAIARLYGGLSREIVRPFQLVSSFFLVQGLKIGAAFLLLVTFGLDGPLAAAPNIQGNVEINVEVGNIVNYAEATGSVAQVAIASMSEGDIGGFTSTVAVGDVVNYATGDGSCAQVLIGSVGVPSCVAGSTTGTDAAPPP